MQSESSPEVVYLPEDVDISRRVAFVLATVERETGVNGFNLPLSARIDNALLGAMHMPSAVDPESYTLLYRLRYGRQPLGTVA